MTLVIKHFQFFPEVLDLKLEQPLEIVVKENKSTSAFTKSTYFILSITPKLNGRLVYEQELETPQLYENSSYTHHFTSQGSYLIKCINGIPFKATVTVTREQITLPPKIYKRIDPFAVQHRRMKGQNSLLAPHQVNDFDIFLCEEKQGDTLSTSSYPRTDQFSDAGEVQQSQQLTSTTIRKNSDPLVKITISEQKQIRNWIEEVSSVITLQITQNYQIELNNDDTHLILDYLELGIILTYFKITSLITNFDFFIYIQFMSKLPLVISNLVKTALNERKAVVALESTIITHGMDYPTNLETCLQVEAVVRNNGAVPATIGIIEGVIHVGLSHEQLTSMAQNRHNYQKCSRRDLAAIIANKQNGSTTVATTMICAQWAGIRVFATGGIGGVHRGAEITLDISADLFELGQTPVVVVCAGAKSILDIPKTLEYLETQGVPVVGFQTQEFPNFFTSSSGQKCSTSVDNVRQAAQLIHTQYDILGLKNGILIGVPIQAEEAANGAEIQHAIDQALKEAENQGIKGAQVTPFLLHRINEITEGRSSISNVALIKNNAKIAAQIAIEILNIEQ